MYGPRSPYVTVVNYAALLEVTQSLKEKGVHIDPKVLEVTSKNGLGWQGVRVLDTIS